MAVALQLFVPLLLTGFSSSAGHPEKVKILNVKGGNSITVNCFTPQKDFMSMDLLWRLEKEASVLFFYQSSNKVTLGEQYKDRVKWEGKMTNLLVTLLNVTLEDSGIYWCVYNKVNQISHSVDKTPANSSTLVVVDGDERSCPPGESPLLSKWVIIATISAGLVFLLCLVVLLICLGPRVRRMSTKRSHVKTTEFVYEDMGKTLRTPR